MNRARYYPNEQVDALWNFILANEIPGIPCKEQLRLRMLVLTDANKICMFCKTIKAEHYIRCPGCDLYYYCSEQCVDYDTIVHGSECKNVGLPQEKIRDEARFAGYDINTRQTVKF